MRSRCSRLQIVYDMEQAGVEPTAYTYTILLDCLAQRGKAFDGFQVTWPAPRPCVCAFFCLLIVYPRLAIVVKLSAVSLAGGRVGASGLLIANDVPEQARWGRGGCHLCLKAGGREIVTG